MEQDPLEHGIRKALNLGHTVGHAFESLALAEGRPVLHGYAVGNCLRAIPFLYKGRFSERENAPNHSVHQKNYGGFAFNCKQYDHFMS